MNAEHEALADDLIRAVELLAGEFESRSIRYAIVGGLATLLRGRPRFTQDVHLLIDVPQFALPDLLDGLAGAGFRLDRSTVIREYVQEHMTAFAFVSVRIDWIKPVIPIYARALSEASKITWTEGHSINVAAPEGLILTKLLAFRPQDQVDIETLLIANRGEIDIAKIRDQWADVSDGEDERTNWLEGAISKHA